MKPMTAPTAIASTDLTSRLRSSRRCSIRGIRPSSSASSAEAPRRARMVPLIGVGGLSLVQAMRRSALGALSLWGGASLSGIRCRRVDLARLLNHGPGTRRLVVLLAQGLGLGLEDPHGPAERTSGIRHPLGSEQEHDHDEDED